MHAKAVAMSIGARVVDQGYPGVTRPQRKGFVLTGAAAGAEGLLETSVPGIYAAGDVRAGSIKRCDRVGEGSAMVRFVHERL